MHNFLKLAAALIFGATMSASALAAGNAFVTVNGVAVPQSLGEAIVAEQIAQGAPDSPELRKAVRERLIARELLIQEAKKSGIDKRPEVAAQADAARQQVILNAFMQDYANKHPVSDAELQSAYDKIKAQGGNTEYKVRHIVVASEDDAKAIIAKLKSGSKFEELAKQSIDQGTKDNGGDLGWAVPVSFPKPFGDAITFLSKGKFTETPVKTEMGFHIILVEDSKPLVMKPFEEVKSGLAQQAQGQQIGKMLEGLRAKAKIQ